VRLVTHSDSGLLLASSDSQHFHPTAPPQDLHDVFDSSLVRIADDYGLKDEDFERLGMSYADPCRHVLCSPRQFRSSLQLILGLLSLIALSAYAQLMFAPSPFAPPLVKTVHNKPIPSKSPDPLTSLSHLDDSVIHLFDLDDDFDDDYGMNVFTVDSIPSESLALRSRLSPSDDGVSST
jgi:hypothetical protein